MTNSGTRRWGPVVEFVDSLINYRYQYSVYGYPLQRENVTEFTGLPTSRLAH